MDDYEDFDQPLEGGMFVPFFDLLAVLFLVIHTVAMLYHYT